MNATHVATCLCGAVRLEIARAPRQLTECNCSGCRRWGALWSYHSERTVRVVAARGATRAHSWGSKRLAFHHCTTCGCLTHHRLVRRRPDGTVAVNARLLPPETTAGLRIRLLDGAATWKVIGERVG